MCLLTCTSKQSRLNAVGAEMHKWGQLRVRDLLCKQSFAPAFKSSPIIAQCSSLGVRQAAFLQLSNMSLPYSESHVHQ